MNKRPRVVQDAVKEYLNGYEFRGDEACHTPTEDERLLIEDCVQGLLADDDFLNAMREWQLESLQARNRTLTELLREARQYVSDAGNDEDQDVQRLHGELVRDIDKALS